jgi:transcription elongation factor GreA
MDKQPMTPSGKAKLEAELKKLISVERPAVIREIEEARANGDLSENADYDAAKERQGFIEATIGDIQNKLANAEVVDPSKIQSESIVFGATVTLIDCETDEQVTYQIVGEDEADIKQKRLSVFSPLSRALIGKKAEDVVEFKSPKGEKEFEVIKVEYK